MGRQNRGETGAALIIALVVLLVLLGLSGVMVPLAALEVRVSANHRRSVQRLYAAEAALELAVHALGEPHVWDRVAADGAPIPGWSRRDPISMDDGYLFSLSHVTQELGQESAVMSGARDWMLAGHTQLADVVPASGSTGAQPIAVWLAHDSSAPDPRSRLVLYAAALGPGPARRAIRAVVEHHSSGRVRIVSWGVAR